MTFVKSTFGRVFGGYTEVPWSSERGWMQESKSFMFSLDDETVYRQKSEGNSVFHNAAWGPVFKDFKIIDKSDATNFNKEGTGEIYGFESGVNGGDLCCKGNNEGFGPGQDIYFTVEELEVYQVIQDEVLI
jgi:hypothetical protein